MTQQDSISLHTLPPLDWSSTGLGKPANWPACLRLSVDIMLNCPLAMAIAWGPEKTLLYNKAYAALTGARAESVPGGCVPTIQPAVFGWNGAAMEAVWGGAALVYASQPVPLWHDGKPTLQSLDLHYTPLRDDSGAVRGILCAIHPATAARHVPAHAPEAAPEPVPSAAPAAWRPITQTSAADGADGGAEAGPYAAAHAAAQVRILVVEDNADAQYLVCEMLRALGYEVEAAGDGERALALLQEGGYGILFSDVSLPGMSGVELARAALREQPHIQVVFASGYGTGLTSQLDFPAVSMQKPYEIEQLQEVLAGAAARLSTVRL